MKFASIYAVFALLVVPAFALAADDSKAEQQIKARAEEFSAAWQKHDGGLIAAFYTKDGELVTGNGRAYSGRDEIEETLKGAFDGSLKDSAFSWTVEKVKLIKPDVAIVDYDAQLKRSASDDAPLKFHMVSVLVKQDGKWLTQTSRGIVYAQN
jgi:uncharacterized protein (TIGR02246 family)